MFDFYFIRQIIKYIMINHSPDFACDAFQLANIPKNFDDINLSYQFMTPGTSNTINSVRHIEVFLIYTAYHQRRRSDFNQFFENPLLDLTFHILDKPIFLQEEKALQYMQFVGGDHCIFHAYIPESAIEGHFDELQIKKEVLDKSHIHGCYPCYAKGEEYILNNSFDKSLLPLVVYSKEDTKFT